MAKRKYTCAEQLDAMERRRGWDAIYRFLIDEEGSYRREIVKRIERYLRVCYRRELNNPQDPMFRQLFDTQFAQMMRNDPVTREIQVVLLAHAIALEGRIKSEFCPAPIVSVNANGEDSSLVDRTAYVLFETLFLGTALTRFLYGMDYSVADYACDFGKYYMLFSPADPKTAPGRKKVRSEWTLLDLTPYPVAAAK